MENFSKYVSYWGNCGESYMGNERYLYKWDKAKSLYLRKLLGGALKLEFPIDQPAPADYLANEVCEVMSKWRVILINEIIAQISEKIINTTKYFTPQELEWVEIVDNTTIWASSTKLCRMNMSEEECENAKTKVVLAKTLFYPFFFNTTFWTNEGGIPREYEQTIVLPNGKKYAFTGKPIKALRRLFKTAEVELPTEMDSLLERYGQEMSVATNKKRLVGTLVLSIDPIDYVTASDNDYNWCSCMSWRNNGDYHAGTLEVMNSANTIVAYLKGEKDCVDESGATFSNKKWRQFFVVEENFIATCKGYPYTSEQLEELVFSTIGDLAAKNLDWHYNAEVKDNKESNNGYTIPELKVTLRVNDVMYNDFEWNTTVYVLKDGVEEPEFSTDIEWTAPAGCLVCGESFDSPESCLCYIHNHEEYVCPNCGCVHYDSDNLVCDANGNEYCIECASYCLECDAYHPNNEIISINYYTCYRYNFGQISVCKSCFNKHPKTIKWDDEAKEYYYDDGNNDYYISPTEYKNRFDG